MSITIESILLDRINELSQQVEARKSDLRLAVKELNKTDEDLDRLQKSNDELHHDKTVALNHIIDILLQVDEAHERAEKDGAASFVEEIKEILDEWNATYKYK